MDDLFLFQHITKPTRFRKDESPSLLDLVFTNEQDMISNLSYLPPLGKSDHICIHFELLCYSAHKKADNVRYNVGAANIELMKETLGNVDWVSILDPLEITRAWLLFRKLSFRVLLMNVSLLLNQKIKRTCTVTLKCLL